MDWFLRLPANLAFFVKSDPPGVDSGSGSAASSRRSGSSAGRQPPSESVSHPLSAAVSNAEPPWRFDLSASLSGSRAHHQPLHHNVPAAPLLSFSDQASKASRGSSGGVNVGAHGATIKRSLSSDFATSTGDDWRKRPSELQPPPPLKRMTRATTTSMAGLQTAHQQPPYSSITSSTLFYTPDSTAAAASAVPSAASPASAQQQQQAAAHQQAVVSRTLRGSSRRPAAAAAAGSQQLTTKTNTAQHARAFLLTCQKHPIVTALGKLTHAKLLPVHTEGKT